MAVKLQSKNTPLIQRYGQLILDSTHNPDHNSKIIDARKEFQFDFDIDFENPDLPSNREQIISYIHRLMPDLDINPDNIVIIHKNIPEKGLNWHIDDCQLVTMKAPPKYNIDCYLKLADYIPDSGNKYLYFNPDTPTGRPARYTILFYSSSYGHDFDGGLLYLADGMKITPMKGHGFMVDTREAHMVTPITRGTRKVSVVKIY